MLENKINLDTLKSFGDAVIEVAQIFKELNDKSYTNLLIPSRGAYPFYTKALRCNELEWSENIGFVNLNTFILPFSSDSFEEENRPESVRDYWVGVYDSIMRGENKILGNYYKFICQHICKDKGDIIAKYLNTQTGNFGALTHLYPQENLENRCIFLDTAISGRASSTILQSMEKRNIDFSAIIVVDKNGDKLTYPYKQYLQTLQGLGKAKLIYVDQLFTEDQSPLLLGMNTLIFPSLVEAGGEIEEISSLINGHPGAAITLMPPVKNLKFSSKNELIINYWSQIADNGSFHVDNLLNLAVRYQLARKGLGGGNKRKLKYELKDALDQVVCKKNKHLFSHENTLELYNPLFNRLKIKPEHISTTSSHLINVDFSTKDTKRLIEKFKDQVLREK